MSWSVRFGFVVCIVCDWILYFVVDVRYSYSQFQFPIKIICVDAWMLNMFFWLARILFFLMRASELNGGAKKKNNNNN